MTIELRPFRDSDLAALSLAVSDACSWLDLAAVLAEKLGPDSAGNPPEITVADDGAPVGLTVCSGNRIRLLAVARHARGRGIGTALLAASETCAAQQGHQTLSCCDEAGNYLAPGIDDRDPATVEWLGKRGFRVEGENHSLVIALSENPKVSQGRADEAKEACEALGYQLRRLSAEDRERLVADVRTAHGGAWAMEVDRAAAAPCGVFVCEKDGELVAFAAHDGNNRGLGWFGPAATAPEHRSQGLGAALLLACLRDVANAGHAECTISWIGPRSFYDRVASIADTRRYLVMRKPLDPSE